ncbi:hypothetical protein ABVT39_011796 [Epinephelus coioides]
MAVSVSLLSVGGYLREVCRVVVKLLLKHQLLFSSAACVGPLLGPLLGRLHNVFLWQREAFLSILDDTAAHHERHPPPAQVDIPGTQAREAVGFQGARGKVGGGLSYKLNFNNPKNSECEDAYI